MNSIQPLSVPRVEQEVAGGQVLHAQVVEIHVAQLRLGRVQGRIGILRMARSSWMFCSRQRIRNVVPGHRHRRQRDGLVEGGHALVGLIGGDVGLAQRDLQQRILGMDVDGLFQLRNRFGIPLLVHIEQAQIGMGVLVQRIDLNLLLELLDGVVILRLMLIDQSQPVVGKLIVRIDLDLLLECLLGLVVLAQRQISAAQIVPGRLVLRIQLHHALQ